MVRFYVVGYTKIVVIVLFFCTELIGVYKGIYIKIWDLYIIIQIKFLYLYSDMYSFIIRSFASFILVYILWYLLLDSKV